MNKVKSFFKSTAGMVLIVTILVGIVVHLATGNFFTAYNISTLTRAASFVIIVGFGQTIVLLTGGIDLSGGYHRICLRYVFRYFYGKLWNESISRHYYFQSFGNHPGRSEWILYRIF